MDVESFVILVGEGEGGGGGGGKYAKTWSLPKAILSGRWVITTQLTTTSSRLTTQTSLAPHTVCTYICTGDFPRVKLFFQAHKLITLEFNDVEWCTTKMHRSSLMTGVLAVTLRAL